MESIYYIREIKLRNGHVFYELWKDGQGLPIARSDKKSKIESIKDDLENN